MLQVAPYYFLGCKIAQFILVRKVAMHKSDLREHTPSKINRNKPRANALAIGYT